jgi:hypothetical protein
LLPKIQVHELTQAICLQVSAEKFIMALLSALTDDDQVNILRFNVEVESPIDCFNDKLVPVRAGVGLLGAVRFSAFCRGRLFLTACRFHHARVRRHGWHAVFPRLSCIFHALQ